MWNVDKGHKPPLDMNSWSRQDMQLVKAQGMYDC